MQNENDIALTGDTGDFEVLQNDESFKNLLQLFPNVNSILIPKKAEYNLRKYVSKDLLKEVDTDINIAVEKCLLILSNLSVTLYFEDNDNPENRWIHLNSKILHKQTKNQDNTYLYRKIIEILKIGTKMTGAIIEVCENFEIGSYSMRYRLTETYFKAGLIEYNIKNEGIIQSRNKFYYKQLKKVFDNPICKNLISIYPKLDLPTKEHLLEMGKQLVKSKYITKKGKILTMRNKHKNNYWSDSNNRSFVEDNIELFQFLTNRGFMIPITGDDKSGGRIVDSFTLMPAWIRNEITIEGKKLVECDYMALHPNIAMKVYGGNHNYLTHEKISETTGINLKEVKVEHLSFFNKTWDGMRKSPLFKYYSNHEADMLSKIYYDKKANGHKITSKNLFKLEVAIMADVIKELNSKGVYVVYVYDALYCEEKNHDLVVATMNDIILNHDVKTIVKSNLINNSNELHTKDNIKMKLLEMIDLDEYQNQKIAINLMLYNMEDKSLEKYNEMYQYIKNMEVMNLGKTG